MKKREILPNEKFGRLTAVRFVKRIYSDDNNYRDIWTFRCECDPEKEIERCLRDVVIGRTQSCGCFRKETTRKRLTTHGDASKSGRTRMYTIFTGIGQRCNNPNYPDYAYWGGRGIKCLWTRYEDFKRDMGPTYKPGLTIGRIDNEHGHYCKENCRWETHAEQNRNYSRNVFIPWRGKTQCVADWAVETGINPETIARRIKSGWSPEEALTIPPLNGKAIQFNGETRTIIEWARVTNVPVTALYARLDRGWTIEKTLTTPIKLQTGV